MKIIANVTRKTCIIKTIVDLFFINTQKSSTIIIIGVICNMKQKCNTCHKNKELEEFYKSNRRKSGYEIHCKVCKNHKRKQRHKSNPDCYKQKTCEYNKNYNNRHPDHAEKTRIKYNDYYKRYSLETIKKIRELKKTIIDKFGGKCHRCHNSYESCVYDFHHKNPEEKKFSIATLIAKSIRNESKKQELLEELNKCIMVCANCHRCIHYNNDTD